MHPVVLSFLPFFEPRYAIVLCEDAVCFAAVGLLVPFILSLLLTLLIDVANAIMQKIFGNLWVRYVESARKRVRTFVGRWGLLGLTAFVAIPLPFTGIYTGAVAAYAMGYSAKESFPYLFLGGVLSCLPGLLLAIA